MSAHPRRVSSRALAFFAIAFAVFATSLAAASPASAHYELLNTDPAADSVVTALPDRLSLTFSGTLLADPGATVVEVVDASGASLAEGAPTVDGAVVSQALTGEADGPITVRWKVVYDDGHTGSDQFGFTVEAPAPTPTPTRTATPTPTTPPAPTPTESAGPSVAPEPPASAFDATPWLIGGGILLVAVAGAVTYLLVSRAKRERALEGGDRSGSQPPRGR